MLSTRPSQHSTELQYKQYNNNFRQIHLSLYIMYMPDRTNRCIQMHTQVNNNNIHTCMCITLTWSELLWGFLNWYSSWSILYCCSVYIDKNGFLVEKKSRSISRMNDLCAKLAASASQHAQLSVSLFNWRSLPSLSKCTESVVWLFSLTECLQSESVFLFLRSGELGRSLFKRLVVALQLLLEWDLQESIFARSVLETALAELWHGCLENGKVRTCRVTLCVLVSSLMGA